MNANVHLAEFQVSMSEQPEDRRLARIVDIVLVVVAIVVRVAAVVR